MFTGIIEEVGEVVEVLPEGSNVHVVVRARMAPELKVDQSVSHKGVCLTVVRVDRDLYTVTIVKETLLRSNLGTLRTGDPVDLERSLRIGDRLDGHMVQGHVDTVVTCAGIHEEGGSWRFDLSMPEQADLLVEKGSICLNGVSLTIAALRSDGFSVAIIPYTFGHTSFADLRVGDRVNVEYDVLGKYVQRQLAKRR